MIRYNRQTLAVTLLAIVFGLALGWAGANSYFSDPGFVFVTLLILLAALARNGLANDYFAFAIGAIIGIVLALLAPQLTSAFEGASLALVIIILIITSPLR
jgi:hypothetical protein